MSARHILGVLILASGLAICLAVLGPGGSQFLTNPGIASGAQNVTSTVLVTSSTPSISSVVISQNPASAGSSTPQYIVLTASTTVPVYVMAQILDPNGCTDTYAGSTTILLYRSGLGGGTTASSTCNATSTTNNTSCYKASAFNSTGTCTGAGSTTFNVTTTFSVWFYADATDASSAYSGQNWMATIIVTSTAGVGANGDTPRATTSDMMQTLSAINVTTSSINYSSVSAGSNTGSGTFVATTTNVGNSTTTLQLSAYQTLMSGANVIATGSQYYATSSFTYGGSTGTALTGSAFTVNGFLLVTPTTSAAVPGAATFWELGVPSGTPAGTYNGFNQFTALWHS